jgi:hypothetical protein
LVDASTGNAPFCRIGEYYDKDQDARQHGKPCDIQMLIFLDIAACNVRNNTLPQVVQGECA